MAQNKLLEFDYLYTKSFKDFYFVGVDEVGRGALAGPVIACAFSWKHNISKIRKKYGGSIFLKLNDSKKLNKSDRKEMYFDLMKSGNFGLGYASVLEIEKLNILNATFLAMKRAFDSLIDIHGNNSLEPYLLIDGNKFNPYINCRQSFIIHGDAKSSLIAGASIIAKVYRDMLMNKISKIEEYKKFGWSNNVGYGTNFHCKAIKKFGITPLHRKLFVRKVV